MANLADAIRKALDEHDATESNERLEARLAAIEEQRGADFTKDELKRILSELDDDDRDEIVAALIGPERWEAVREHEPPATSEEPAQSDDDPSPPARRTRPGRKTGGVYQWDIDEDGNVVELDLGVVYSGEDEPEEVELPDVIPDEEEAT